MPSLIVFRHGKSDWQAGDGDDRSRPLSARGRRSASAMGRFLAASGQVPELVLTSPALRALETLRLAAEAGGWSCKVETREALYEGVAEILAEVRLLAPGVLTCMLVGHEPASSELTAALIGGGRVRLATAAMARVELDIGSWAELEPGCGELSWLVQSRLAEEAFLPRRGGSAEGRQPARGRGRH